MTTQLLDVVRQSVHALLAPFAAPVQHARGIVDRAPGLALLLLAVLVFAAVRAIRGDRLSALALVPLSLAWLVFNGPFEGPTLLVISWSHGVTVGDLLGFVGLGISAWRLGQRVLAPLR